MIYDIASGKLKCQYCGNMKTVQEMDNNDGVVGKTEENKKDTQDIDDEFEVGDGDTVDGEFVNDDSGETVSMKVYHCSNCGAQILTDESTVSTFCSFCGRPSMLEDRIEGEKKPAYVIPFKIEKDAAVSKYRSWTKKGILTPSSFKKSATIEKISGIYVPFWLYDYDAEMMLEAEAKKIKKVVSGDVETTITDYYRVLRDLETTYIKIPADASEKMPDDVMDKLEPFDYNMLAGFEMPYLAGYYAEKYNYTGEEMAPRVEYRVKSYINTATMNTIQGYDSVVVAHRDVRLKRLQAKYAMLPVWILNCQYRGKNFMFAMNGQTGKIVAERPVSKEKTVGLWGAVTAGLFAILFSVGRFLL